MNAAIKSANFFGGREDLSCNYRRRFISLNMTRKFATRSCEQNKNQKQKHGGCSPKRLDGFAFQEA